jgi:RES domain-containing protein
MQIYRIADRRHPVWDGTGAMLMGGRFNSPGKPVIYGSLSFAGAMLEVLAHARIGKVPRNHVYVKAEAPEGLTLERAAEDCLPQDWDAPDSGAAREFGDRWLDQRRSAVLLVPSVVARLEWNALVNPAHPDAMHIDVTDPAPVIWDARLFHAG